MIEKYEDIAKKFYPHIYKIIQIITQDLDTKVSNELIQSMAIETEKHYASHDEKLDKLLENQGFVDSLMIQINHHIKTNTSLTEQLEKYQNLLDEQSKELKTLKAQNKDTNFKTVLDNAQKALDDYDTQKYRQILKDYRKQEKHKELIQNISQTHFLSAKSYAGDFIYDQAIDHIAKAVALDENNSDYLHWYGYIANGMGDYDTALKYYQKSLVIYEKVRGTNHPDTATSYNNIGEVYKSKGEYDKALEFYQKDLAICEEVLGIKDPDTATSYNNIGEVYRAKGEYDKALEFYQKSLAIKEEVLGMKHPSTATSYNNIGGVYYAKGEYDKSLEFSQKSLAIQEEVLGKKHPSTATSYNNIGGVYQAKGEYDKALEFYQKDLTINEEVLGTKHRSTAGSYNNIAVLYGNMQNYPESATYMQKAVDIREKVLPANHPDLIDSKEDLAAIKAML
jgi:tetratricopeptide (TPR) repeat protein